jgi:transcriptional regulator GlxA family with amidase domain
MASTNTQRVEGLGGPPRTVVLLATPNAQSLELAGPAEVFAMAGQKLREAGRTLARGYRVQIVSAVDDLTIKSSSGLTMTAEVSFKQVTSPVDTLLVAGGMTVWTAVDQTELLAWLRETALSVRRIGSVCTGAFVLAEAGLLDGKRVTTHWYFCSQLAHQHPAVIVDSEPIFVRDGNVSTSAGVTAGIDLALAMVEEDLGADIALRIARALVLFLRRPGGQNQFSTSLSLQSSSRLPIRELPIYILENLDSDLSVEALASRVSMSVRNFSRVFREEFDQSPGVFVEELRLDTARRLLLESNRSIEEIAALCGLGERDAMRASFRRRFKASPAEIRGGRRTPI